MERITNGNSENGSKKGPEISNGWEAWDAVPRDGPAVFVLDVDALDHGTVRGCWLDINAGDEVLQAELTELLGREPEEGAWAVVDQVGLGELMAPETMALAELASVANDLAAELRG